MEKGARSSGLEGKGLTPIARSGLLIMPREVAVRVQGGRHALESIAEETSHELIHKPRLLDLGRMTTLRDDDLTGMGHPSGSPDGSRHVRKDVILISPDHEYRLLDLAQYCGSPVINGLTDRFHPCQALADLFTLQEARGTLTGTKLEKRNTRKPRPSAVEA